VDRRSRGGFRTPEDGMLSRALSLATVMLVIVGFATDRARAQNLEAGKSAAQIFSGNCTACHKGARGLLRTVAPGSLPGFLRQHYTTGPDMAGCLAPI
jgi:mono/diheme cytochrome c family protein